MDSEEIVNTLSFVAEEHKPTLKRLLASFPDYVEDWFWAPAPDRGLLLQGDMIDEIPLLIPSLDAEPASVAYHRVVLLSNSCDVEQGKGDFGTVAPVIGLDAMESGWIEQGLSASSWADRLAAIRHNQVTNLLYLPGSTVMKPSAALLELASAVAITELAGCKDRKLHSLSRYGHYLLLTKLVWHFARPESADAVRWLAD
ncbi:MAG: hypothetical protein ACYC5Q_16570 [Thermoleophilia bacterium]